MKKTVLMSKAISVIAIIMTIVIGLSSCEFILPGLTLETIPSITTTSTNNQPPNAPQTTEPTHVHDVVIDSEVAPTCTQSGKTEGTHCSTCNAILTAQKVVPALGHTERTLPAVPATYESTGLSEGLLCTVCEKTLIEQKVIDKLLATHHAIIYHDYKGATIEDKYWSYSSNEGMATLPRPTAEKFVFIGWFTEGGTRITSIPSGSTQDYDLFARWEQVEFTINYNDPLVGTIIPSGTYTKGVGLASLPKPESAGYEFLGWSETIPTQSYKKNNIPSSNDLKLLSKITTEDAKMYELYAHWVRKDYDIIYKDAPQPNNPTTYTIEDSFILQEPQWTGLTFVNWVNEKNEPITEITTGNTGALVLKAVWKPKENTVTPAKGDNTISVGYDENAQVYISIHYLGTIEHIAIGEVVEGSTIKYKNPQESISLTISQTTSFEESMAEEAATIIGSSYITSQEFSATFRMLLDHSETHSGEMAFGLGTGEKAKVKTTIDGKLGYQETDASERESAVSNLNGLEFGTNKEYSTASTLSYTKEFSKTTEETRTISAEMPEGYYSYVYAANVRIYNIIIYDPIEKNYYTETYSYVTDIHSIVLYYRDDTDRQFPVVDTLPYNIPIEDLIKETQAASFLKISYNANSDATGIMNDTAHLKINAATLPKNEFNRPGYTFTGWNTEIDGSGITYIDGEQIPLQSMGENLSLYAQWEANSYTIIYDANGGNGSMSTSTHIYDEAKTLSANNFSRTGWTFMGWSKTPNGAVEYENIAEVKNLTDQANGNVTLYAVWNLRTSGSTYLSGPYTIDHKLDESLGVYICDLSKTFDLQELAYQKRSLTIAISCTAQAKDKKEETAWMGFFLYESSKAYDPDDGVVQHYTNKKFTGTITLTLSASVSAEILINNSHLHLFFCEDAGFLWDTDYWTATNINITVHVN